MNKKKLYQPGRTSDGIPLGQWNDWVYENSFLGIIIRIGWVWEHGRCYLLALHTADQAHSPTKITIIFIINILGYTEYTGVE